MACSSKWTFFSHLLDFDPAELREPELPFSVNSTKILSDYHRFPLPIERMDQNK